MTLTRGTALGYDVAGMTFRFTMIDDAIRIIQCDISAAAMDEIDESSKGKGTFPDGREAQFAKLRDRIESTASELFDLHPTRPDRLRIFYHHVRPRKDR